MALTDAEQAQLDALNTKAQDTTVEAPPHSLAHILHNIVDTIGRPQFHKDIDQLELDTIPGEKAPAGAQGPNKSLAAGDNRPVSSEPVPLTPEEEKVLADLNARQSFRPAPSAGPAGPTVPIQQRASGVDVPNDDEGQEVE